MTTQHRRPAAALLLLAAFCCANRETQGTAAAVMNMAGWLVGGSFAPITVGILAEYAGLGTALGCTAAIYVAAASILLLACRAAGPTGIAVKLVA